VEPRVRSEIDYLTYTKRMLAEHWGLLEDHFLWAKRFGADEGCLNCIWGHLVKISGYVGEGLKFAKTHEDEDMFRQMGVVGQDLEQEIFMEGKEDWKLYARMAREMRYLPALGQEALAVRIEGMLEESPEFAIIK